MDTDILIVSTSDSLVQMALLIVSVVNFFLQLFSSLSHLVILLSIYRTFINLFYPLTCTPLFYSLHSLLLLFAFTIHLCTYLLTWIYLIRSIFVLFPAFTNNSILPLTCLSIHLFIFPYALCTVLVTTYTCTCFFHSPPPPPPPPTHLSLSLCLFFLTSMFSCCFGLV